MGDNMYNKFKMELTWHNCKTCPPKEFENNNLLVTNGTYVYGMSWHRAEGYFIADDYGNLHQLKYEHLDTWYWADIEQTVRGEEKFREG